MKFFHTADIHLGARPDAEFPWGEERQTEIWESFRLLIQRAEEEQIDLLLIAGDLFHRQPLKRELKELNYFFTTLTRTKVVIIAGNHDYLKPDSYYRTFEWSNNVHFLYGSDCEKKSFPELNTEVYGFSYHTREITEHRYDNLKPENSSSFKVLLAHGGDEKHIPFNKKKLQNSGFDYIALGHIHKPRTLFKNYLIYPGALEPLDKNDTGVHGFISGTVENGKLTAEFIPWASREYINLDITCDVSSTDFSLKEKITDSIEKNGKQHIYIVTIMGQRDPDIVFHVSSYLQSGNIIQITDRSEPAYDFEKLQESNHRNIIGRYISRLNDPGSSEIQKKALYLGVQALLEAQR